MMAGPLTFWNPVDSGDGRTSGAVRDALDGSLAFHGWSATSMGGDGGLVMSEGGGVLVEARTELSVPAAERRWSTLAAAVLVDSGIFPTSLACDDGVLPTSVGDDLNLYPNCIHAAAQAHREERMCISHLCCPYILAAVPLYLHPHFHITALVKLCLGLDGSGGMVELPHMMISMPGRPSRLLWHDQAPPSSSIARELCCIPPTRRLLSVATNLLECKDQVGSDLLLLLGVRIISSRTRHLLQLCINGRRAR